jgi:hypothetical protein
MDRIGKFQILQLSRGFYYFTALPVVLGLICGDIDSDLCVQAISIDKTVVIRKNIWGVMTIMTTFQLTLYWTCGDNENYRLDAAPTQILR